MTEWYKKYQNATEVEVVAQALEACSRLDCVHCLYQGGGIQCANRLKLDAVRLLQGKQ